ncbi:single-stranded DNA-binding protein, mitochondrial [Vigna radiata var. radiata]|uniref:Single-stranded DNA-binding protein, mitochondrial n=1 Tax=Vigna radiata var. radiata TaxID=3916 RepID=A0A1S3UND8_VIGRR|nr:single-stranded DNA-binding protein, mitochondrial [Vigna radiata var. radiata]
MSSSMVTLSRSLYRSLLRTPNTYHHLLPLHFSTDLVSDSDEADSPPDSPSPDPAQGEQRIVADRPLENGLDIGIYRAILVGKAGQVPFQKTLKSGTVVTLLSVGTGGIRNNRRPLENENPRDYANRSAIQWHRVSIYPQRLGTLVAKHVVPGSMLYVEGNLETKVFTDPITGLARRIREVAVRRNGRVVFLGQGGDVDQDTQQNNLKAVGYY